MSLISFVGGSFGSILFGLDDDDVMQDDADSILDMGDLLVFSLLIICNKVTTQVNNELLLIHLLYPLRPFLSPFCNCG